jgi:hypothetical protein
LEGDDSDKEQ